MTPDPSSTSDPGWVDSAVGVGLSLLCLGLIVCVMAAIGAYLRWKGGIGPRLAAALEFEQGATGLYALADAFPLNVDGGAVVNLQYSAHGTWRGRRAESVVVAANGDAVLMGSFRVELVEIPGRLPRVEFLARHRESVIPVGGGNVVDVESEEFNQAFDVICADPAYAHAVLQPRMIERLLRPDARHVSITVSGSTVFCWLPTKDGVAGARGRLELVSDVADLLPGFLEGKFGLTSTLPEESEVFLPEADGPPVALPRLAMQLPRALWRPVAPDAEATRNWMVTLGWVFFGSLVLWPLGIVMGHMALRAVRAGKATNAPGARRLLYVGYGVGFALLWLASCQPWNIHVDTGPLGSATPSPSASVPAGG